MLLNKPDIVSTIEPYAELKKRGRYYWALCPLPGHIEKTASFKVDPGRQTFYCFGCGIGGDVIQFVMQYHNMSFKEALQHLGINGKTRRPDSKEMKKRELLSAFREWCDTYFDDLCTLVRTLQKAKQNAKTMEEVEAMAEYYHKESVWLYQIEILQSNDDKAKFKLYRELSAHE